LIYLLRAMAPAEALRAAPLVSLYSFAVFTVFFVVAVRLPTTAAGRSYRGRHRRGGRDGDPPVVP
jgi:hypothetical protein